MTPKYETIKDGDAEGADPGLMAIRDVVVQQFLQTMLVYGVGSVTMNETKAGMVYVLAPRIVDLVIPDVTRPDSLTAARNNIFTHWVQMLFMYGFTKIEANPSDEDITKVKALWNRIQKK